VSRLNVSLSGATLQTVILSCNGEPGVDAGAERKLFVAVDGPPSRRTRDGGSGVRFSPAFTSAPTARRDQITFLL
jgi:hypothetical protein